MVGHGRACAVVLTAAAVLLAPACVHAATGPGSLSPSACLASTGAGGACAAQPGLGGALAVRTSADGRNVYVASGDPGTLTAFARDAASGALTSLGCFETPRTGAGRARGADGLAGARAVAISPDGMSVYVVGDTTLATFARDSRGRLAPRGCLAERGSGPGCSALPEGLANPTAVAVSRDGRSAYVTGATSHSVMTLARDRASGALTPRGCVADRSAPGPCADRSDGLRGAAAVAESSDGRTVYVAGGAAGAVVAFERRPGSGRLVRPRCIRSRDFAGDCEPGPAALASPASVVVAPDGRFVYVVSFEGSILAFRRDPWTGALGFRNCVGSTSDCVAAPALDGPTEIAFSPEGRHAYVTAALGSTVAVFERRPATGSLGYVACAGHDGSGGCGTHAPALAGATSLSVSDRSAYVVADRSSALSVFRRERPPGAVPLAIASGSATFRDGAATLRLTGRPARAGPPWRGSVKLTTRAGTTLARGTFAAGATRALSTRVRLTTAGRRALARRGREVLVTVVVRAGGTVAAVAERRVRIRSA